MRARNFSIALTAVLAIFVLILLGASTRAAAQQEKVLHNFGNGADGIQPYAGLIFDAAGDLFGTTLAGGANGYGTVFELKPTAGGNWAERVLHNFYRNSTDGSEPSGLVFDVSGNLYGVTFYGGAYDGGTLFQLMPTAGGTWTEKILHNFSNNGIDGFN